MPCAVLSATGEATELRAEYHGGGGPVSLHTKSGARLALNNAHGASGPVPHSRYLSVEHEASATSTWFRVPREDSAEAFGLMTAERDGIIDDDKAGSVRTGGGDWCLDLVQDADQEVWAGPLDQKKWAVALLNRHPTTVSTISVDFTVFGATAGASFSVQDVWQGTSAGVHKGSYSALVPPQAVAYLILTPVDDTRQRLKSDDQSSSPPQLRLGAARLKVDDADAGSVTVDVTPAQVAAARGTAAAIDRAAAVRRHAVTLTHEGGVDPSPPPACPKASVPVKIHRLGSNAGHLYTANYSACAAACCGRPGCMAWSWDSNETAQQAPADCRAHGKPYTCCWLRGTVGKLMPGLGCYGTPECDSWSGVVGFRPPPSCSKPSPPVTGELIGCDAGQLHTANASACQAACCSDPACVSWNFDSNLTAGIAPAVCRAAGAPFSCCWKKSCAGTLVPGSCAGVPHCASFHGTSGRPPPPPPPRPPPRTCPPGTEYMAGFSCLAPTASGSPVSPGLPAGYDCAVREHMWEFAKKTLPRRGSFKTAYDALQLHTCNVSAPPTEDVFVAPHFPTPTNGEVIYVDAKAATGGDGSNTKPFSTIEAAVEAAGKGDGSGSATIVLRAGRYYTAGIVLSAEHSNLVIQNFEGEEVSVTGALAVPIKNRASWVVHNVSTNTWRLDLADWREIPSETFGMRVGVRRAIRARFPDGDPETLDLGYSLQWLKTFPRTHEPESTTKNFFSYPSDWPGVFWLDEPEGGLLPVAGKNVAGTGPSSPRPVSNSTQVSWYLLELALGVLRDRIWVFLKPLRVHGKRTNSCLTLRTVLPSCRRPLVRLLRRALLRPPGTLRVLVLVGQSPQPAAVGPTDAVWDARRLHVRRQLRRAARAHRGLAERQWRGVPYFLRLPVHPVPRGFGREQHGAL